MDIRPSTGMTGGGAQVPSFTAAHWLLQALQLVESAEDPSASHNCWAFKVAGTARSNDDGEPAGTAGRPILAAIEGDRLDGVCVLVVRWAGARGCNGPCMCD